MLIKDKVFEVYPSNVSAELIAHSSHITSATPEGLAKGCMKEVDPDFHEKLGIGKIMIAANNFGCNSSREWAPAALMYSGVTLIIAQSFSRIFYRNAINIGLPILECPNITELVKAGDEIEADLATGKIINLTTGAQGEGKVLPGFLLDILKAGGLLETLKARKK